VRRLRPHCARRAGNCRQFAGFWASGLGESEPETARSGGPPRPFRESSPRPISAVRFAARGPSGKGSNDDRISIETQAHAVADVETRYSLTGRSKKRRFDVAAGLSREMNHCCDPNTWWAGSISLVARRDIQPGEEVAYDYSTADVDRAFEMECTCGSPRCRGTISNRDYLDAEWRDQYGSNLPPHVLAAIERAG